MDICFYLNNWYQEGVFTNKYRQARKGLLKISLVRWLFLKATYYNLKLFRTTKFWCNKLAIFNALSYSKNMLKTFVMILFSFCRKSILCGWFYRKCKHIWGLFRKLKLRFLEGVFNLCKWRTNNTTVRKLLMVNLTKIIHHLNFREFFGIKRLILFHLNLKKYVNWRVLQNLQNEMFSDPIGMLQPITINLSLIFQIICRLK